MLAAVSGATESRDQSQDRSERRSIESIPPASSNDGVWVEFDGARWYLAGPAMSVAPDRLIQVGARGDFPVYRERVGPAEVIYVPAVQGGLLTVFRRR